MYVLFENSHLSNILELLYNKAKWGTTKKRIKWKNINLRNVIKNDVEKIGLI